MDNIKNENAATVGASTTVPSNELNTEALEQQFLSEDIHVSEVQMEIECIERADKFTNRQKKLITNQTMTIRMAKRMQIIAKTMIKYLVIEDVIKLMHIILSEEKRMGHKDEMCKRSIYRLLTKLSVDKKIRLYKISLKYQQTKKELMFICDASVDLDNSILLSLLEKEKFRFLLRVSNERNRIQTAAKKSTNDSVKVAKVNKQPSIPKKRLTTVDQKVNYGLTPKFIRMRTLHEFLFYMIYGYAADAPVYELEHSLKQWKIVEPRVDYDELHNELSSIYSTEIGWRMFVPPLLPHDGYPKGWALYSDILLRMPLSIFIKIFNVTFEVPGLEKMLMHPIRKHYLLNYLPVSIQNELIGSRKHIFIIEEVLRRLSSCGLVQFGPHRQKEKDTIFLYCNQHASILNTIDSEPGYIHVSDREYATTWYTFNTADDVASYWHDLYRICLSTRLGRKTCMPEMVMIRWELQEALLREWEPRTVVQVDSMDVGHRPGDGRGAGGLDSSLYAHLQRNWSYKRIRYKTRPVKPERKKAQIKMNKRSQVVLAAKRDKRNVIVPVKRYVKPVAKKIQFRARKRPRTPNYDDVDKQALRLMRKLRVDWHPEEDNILLLCKVAMLVLCPPNRRQCVSSQHIRDIMHWHLKSFDKTSKACQRRIVYMMRNESIARSVHLCVQDANDNPEINRRFSFEVYKRLRDQIKQEDDFVRAIKIVFVDLVYVLHKQFLSVTTKTFESRKTILPDTVAEFRQMFNAKHEEYTHERLKFEAPQSSVDIEINVLATLIHSSVCCTYDKASWSIQLYEIYKNYAETTLCAAMAKVRNDQLISANKSSNQSKLSIRNLPLSSTPYHLSVTYQYMLLTKISYESFSEVYSTIMVSLSHKLYAVPKSKFLCIFSGSC